MAGTNFAEEFSKYWAKLLKNSYITSKQNYFNKNTHTTNNLLLFSCKICYNTKQSKS